MCAGGDPQLTQVVLTRLHLPSALPDHDRGAVTALAVDDEGQIDETGGLQFGNENNVDTVDARDETFAAGEFNRQAIGAAILRVSFNDDRLGNIRSRHAAHPNIIGEVKVERVADHTHGKDHETSALIRTEILLSGDRDRSHRSLTSSV